MSYAAINDVTRGIRILLHSQLVRVSPSVVVSLLPPGDALFAAKPRKVMPHAFVLEALAPLAPETRLMFGCLAVYVGGSDRSCLARQR